MIDSLKTLVSEISGEYIGADVSITGVHINSREIEKGQLFVAIKADRDGHDFVQNAIENGACAVLVSDKQHNLAVPQIVVGDTRKALFDLAQAYRSKLNMPVLSLTGSCGKTTTKEMLVCTLSAFGKVHYSKGNFNNDLGVPITILSTPNDADFLVVEAGTNAKGEIPYLATLIQPDIAGITNVSASHLEKLQSLEGVMLEKGALLQALVNKNGCAIINLDDGRIVQYATSLAVQKVSFSMQQQADVQLVSYKASSNKLDYEVRVDDIIYSGQLKIVGKHNIQNALMTLAYIKALKLDIQKSCIALCNFKPYKGRFSLHQVNSYLSVIDDTYNASVQSVKAAIEDLSSFDGVKYIVLSNMGELGEHAEFYHQQVGRWIKEARIDHVYLYGHKEWMEIMRAEVDSHVQYFAAKESLISTLITQLKNMIKQNTRVLIKGSNANKMGEVVVAVLEQYPAIL